MIVTCPSCRTRYRHASAGSDPGLGRCSRCDETFDLAPRARPYLLLPASPIPAAMRPLPAGMDDPSLAAQLQGAGRAVEMVLPPGEGRSFRSDEAAAFVPPRRMAREWFGLVLLTALGAAAGFHGAVIASGDPLNSTAAGTVGGLILGWSWIRSAERKR